MRGCKYIKENEDAAHDSEKTFMPRDERGLNCDLYDSFDCRDFFNHPNHANHSSDIAHITPNCPVARGISMMSFYRYFICEMLHP
jgi:hypothetical protein